MLSWLVKGVDMIEVDIEPSTATPVGTETISPLSSIVTLGGMVNEPSVVTTCLVTEVVFLTVVKYDMNVPKAVHKIVPKELP